MPRLLIFAPCERVILANDQTISLITLVETLQLQIAPDQEIPEGADLAAPFAWQAISLWTKDADDPPDLAFDQKIQLQMPDGTVFVELTLTTQFTPDKKNGRAIFKVLGFPIVRESGSADVKLFARFQGKEWLEAASFPILLSVPQKQ